MNNQSGFTLVEMALVVGILAILAAIVSVGTGNFLRQSRSEAYRTDIKESQQAVDRFFSRDDTPKLRGKTQFPILGASKGERNRYAGDEGTVPEVIPGGIEGNPLGGTIGGNPIWVDDGDGLRSPDEEVLNDEDATGSEPGWHVAQVQFDGKTYYVDSRDYIVDFDRAATLGMVRKPPESAAQDNCPTSRCRGSYIFFVGPNGELKTLLREFPSPETTGYQGVFP